ncbi:hypothetical protein F4779DRAFT_600073 [Xylariaceae sp. FL0662B]|nr:hypothetical protein F4779DRAFT_600073 [Xylariaceae sp. FL0662B]
MCQDLVQCTFKCGHQPLLWSSPSRFCLFYPHSAETFHSANIIFETSHSLCGECAIKHAAHAAGLRGQAKHAHVQSKYAESNEAYWKAEAHKYRSEAAQSQAGVDEGQIAELNAKVQEQILYYVRRGLNGRSKGLLLDTILRAPEVLDRRGFVVLLAENVGTLDEEGLERRVDAWEISMLRAKARKAGLLRAFEEGFPKGAIVVKGKGRRVD